MILLELMRYYDVSTEAATMSTGKKLRHVSLDTSDVRARQVVLPFSLSLPPLPPVASVARSRPLDSQTVVVRDIEMMMSDFFRPNSECRSRCYLRCRRRRRRQRQCERVELSTYEMEVGRTAAEATCDGGAIRKEEEGGRGGSTTSEFQCLPS